MVKITITRYLNTYCVALILIHLVLACSKNTDSGDIDNQNYEPITYTLDIPQIFKENLPYPTIPNNNPLSKEGISLGKKLFFDPILSGDNTQSCASCHDPKNAFTDNDRFSTGIDNIKGTRNSMPLFNLAWNQDRKFMWDGRRFGLEDQALEPVENPIEMHSNWKDVVKKLENHEDYPQLFNNVFGTDTKITKQLVAKAIAQFERTLISGNSKFDNYQLGKVKLTPEELNGFEVFMDEERGDCFHCHGAGKNPLWTDNIFHNNGLDSTFNDLGLGKITGDPSDNGKFRSPSLRNLAYTAPYMHDGRFKTLEEVINHYSEGLVYSKTIDPLMKKIDKGGVRLTDKDKADLKAFLLTLSDPSFINNKAHQQ